MSEVGQSLVSARAAAEAKGQVMILPAEDESSRPSPSGKPGRRHVTVKMPRPVTPIERIALQAFMESDRKRECLSWCRLQDGETTVTRFFEKPETLEGMSR